MRGFQPRETKTYQLRVKLAEKELGKTLSPKRDDEEGIDDAEDVGNVRDNRGKIISHEEVLQLEYKALVSEGQTLYYRNEYHRAIDAFTKAINNNKDDLDILIDRANCYVQVGNPKAALLDINSVLKENPNNTRAILAKAEAFFSMGEFEFALVFFQRGLAIRKDLVAFRDGITKSTHAITDSIGGAKPFQPNPNFAISRPRKPLTTIKKKSAPVITQEGDEAENAKLLPEPVPPLTITVQERSTFLGELALDYDYLVELREEVSQSTDDDYGKKEDEIILKIVNDALIYLDQRAQFWSQQGSSVPMKTERPQTATETAGTERNLTPTRPVSSRRTKVVKVQKVQGDQNSARREAGRTPPISSRRKKDQTPNVAHYEMSKIQLYEAKYGKKP